MAEVAPKRTDLLLEYDVPCLLVREGSRHEFWQVGGVLVSVPRHRDINEWTAVGIMRDLEPMLGKDWWRA
jgi:hypothetical protein